MTLEEYLLKKVEAFAALEKLARQINPAIPDDLTGYVLTITMSKDGLSARAYRG